MRRAYGQRPDYLERSSVMSFDGITVAAMVHELNTVLRGGRISKIAQTESDELMLTIKSPHGTDRLLLSANASLPLVYLTENNKPSPMTAPNFCMLLRKHIGNARLLEITQPSLERVMILHLEHLNELGDVCRKKLILELMGKHSNIIFCNDEDMILDSIKHVSSNVSSVREVLPGRTWFIPQTTQKSDPLSVTFEEFSDILNKPDTLARVLYTSLIGISPVMAQEICFRASLDGDAPAASVGNAAREHLCHVFNGIMDDVKKGCFQPNIILKEGEPIEFGVFPYEQYGSGYTMTLCSSVSGMLEDFYAARNSFTRIRQKSSDLRRIVQTNLDRARKKDLLQKKQLHDTEKKEKYRIYGEMINAYGYEVPAGAKSFEALNYYTGEPVTVPLDPALTPQENAQKYFERYAKLKRTQEALTGQVKETEDEILHLDSVSNALDIAESEADLREIKKELTESGYIRAHTAKKKQASRKEPASLPLHYKSSDGYDIYVGRNNFQNDDLTFRFASGNDWWFHAKKIAGSHVVLKTQGEEVPDRAFEEAGSLAAFYSKGKDAPKVEIDYIQKKHVKKPAGAKPGFVVYYTNYSLMASPDISALQKIDD